MTVSSNKCKGNYRPFSMSEMIVLKISSIKVKIALNSVGQ